jgi:HSP20 family protein
MRSWPVVRNRLVNAPVRPQLDEVADEIRRVFLELGRAFAIESSAAECSPPVDVFETDAAMEVVVDLPGIVPEAVRVIARAGVLLIVGEKTMRDARGHSTFHLVERGFGRFARVVHLAEACDPARASATLVKGELRITVPKIAERRGRTIQIAVTGEGPGTAGGSRHGAARS